MFKDFNSGRECALKEALIVALICKMINGFKVLLFAERNSNKFICSEMKAHMSIWSESEQSKVASSSGQASSA